MRVTWRRTGGEPPGHRATLGPYAFTEEGAAVRVRFATETETVEIAAGARLGADDPRATRAGITGWAPRHILTARLTSHEERDSIEIAFGHGLARPGGLVSTGALRAAGDAISVRYRRSIAVGAGLTTTLEGGLTHLARAGETTLVDTDDT